MCWTGCRGGQVGGGEGGEGKEGGGGGQVGGGEGRGGQVGGGREGGIHIMYLDPSRKLQLESSLLDTM